MMLQQIKPRNARAARALSKREPQIHENPKTTIFLRGNKWSEVCQLFMKDLHRLKTPLAINFDKKKQNDLHPFEDASSFEFFSEKNDASLFVFASHTKKRPNALTLIRCFNHKVLDMLELFIEPESMRTMNQFKNERKPGVGLKPLICFAGTPFENPTSTVYTAAKSMLLDLFKGPDLDEVDVEGLQYMICISAGDEVEDQPPPKIHVRVYLIKTKKSGQRLPRVEVEEMGPRVDFRVGRYREPAPDALKEAMKRPKTAEPKTKKNIETDLMGDKIGRIHVGKQNLNNLQTRKMKGLKRGRVEDGVDMDGDALNMDDDAARLAGDVKRTKI